MAVFLFTRNPRLDAPFSIGNKRMVYGTLTGGTSDYVNGTGYTITPALIGLDRLDHVTVTSNTGGYLPVVTVPAATGSDNAILKVFFPTGGAGTGAANSVQVVTGTSAVLSTSANPDILISPGPATEVASSTNLASVIFTIVAIGV